MNDRRTSIALFIIALVPYLYFYGGWGANQEVNLALTRAMVENGTVRLDGLAGQTINVSTGVSGHLYSNKPPGLSTMAAIPYSVQHALGRRGVDGFSGSSNGSKRLLTILLSGVSGALIAPVLYLYGRRRLGVTSTSAAVTAFAIAFGTLVFPYSTMFFAHVPCALLLLLAFVLLRERPVLAGVAAGIAGSTFLLAAIAAVAMGGLAVRYSARHLVKFIAGGVPFAAALALYQWMAFGSPFLTPAQQSGAFTEEHLVLGLFGAPHFFSRLRWLMHSEYRGLFYCSPALLLAIPGAFVALRRHKFVAELATIAVIAAIFFTSNASFNGWHGGAAFGPRYLLPIVPLLAIPMMFVGDRWRVLWVVLIAAGAAINLAATAVDPMVMDGIQRPVTGYILPTLLHLPVSQETRDLFCPDSPGPDCTPGHVALWLGAGNAGERIFGRGSSASVIPAALWIILTGIALVIRARRQDQESPGSSPKA
ncbi:MAG: hypothetical protein WA208_08995 [Thermoanaerobaculia bacterium]